MQHTTIVSRFGAARATLVAFLLVLAFAVPIANADAATLRATKVTGFDTTYAEVDLLQSPTLTDDVRVRTGGVYTVRWVQVQSRYLGLDPNSPSVGRWQFESASLANGQGNATVTLKPNKVGLWEYRVYVVPLDDAAAAVSGVKRVYADIAITPAGN